MRTPPEETLFIGITGRWGDFGLPHDLRLWEIKDGSTLKEITKSKLDREERLEEWLEKDISVISDDLLVIGRQVPTDFGGAIDLLCIDRYGDIVIVELKRDKTPREIVAQVLEYASWVKDLSQDRIAEIANKYFGGAITLEQAFDDKFGEPLPEVVNENHRMLIVASELDSSTERVINYLSEHGVGLNAVTFHYFKEDNREYLGRVFLIEPQLAERRRESKRKQRLSEEELEQIAANNGVAELYAKLKEGLVKVFDIWGTTKSSLAFIGLQEGRRNTMFSISPVGSSAEHGLKFQIYIKRFSRYFKIDEKTVESILPENKWEWKFAKDKPEYSGYEGFFKNIEEVERFLAHLKKPGQLTQL
jgi:hypothetical protein